MTIIDHGVYFWDGNCSSSAGIVPDHMNMYRDCTSLLTCKPFQIQKKSIQGMEKWAGHQKSTLENTKNLQGPNQQIKGKT